MPPGRVERGVKENEYKALLGSIEAALRIVGEEPTPGAVEFQIRKDLLKMRESLVRARRDRLKEQLNRDSRDPLGVS